MKIVSSYYSVEMPDSWNHKKIRDKIIITSGIEELFAIELYEAHKESGYIEEKDLRRFIQGHEKRGTSCRKSVFGKFSGVFSVSEDDQQIIEVHFLGYKSIMLGARIRYSRNLPKTEYEQIMNTMKSIKIIAKNLP